MHLQNLVELDAPVMVVGDIHGQYFDLLSILRKWRPDHALLFLGDYVDRGAFSCEVMLQLLALKLRHPASVFLLRGNHECSTVSAHFGFKEECKVKYGLTVYYQFLRCFQALPIAALIRTKIGRIFAAHGGISPDIKTLDELNRIDRFAEPDMEGALCDILWSDPLNEDEAYKLTDQEYKEVCVRGCSYMFGYRAVARFLRDNALIFMLRAHEVQEEGFRSHFAAHLHPTVLTVFSAPNYCDRYGNKAAILHVEDTGYYTVNLLEAEVRARARRAVVAAAAAQR
ncbi:Metallo-dependent phosphatase-like protein [Tribonema minus]|uniref:Serine/threonine-protein phosphatase n=1 Tax=Tribonema minus TaxID=303371 RepID=A0A836CLD0_9STRA|nr:Metallo-dependent phosphatase-like protein [Tribonema minus]